MPRSRRFSTWSREIGIRRDVLVEISTTTEGITTTREIGTGAITTGVTTITTTNDR